MVLPYLSSFTTSASNPPAEISDVLLKVTVPCIPPPRTTLPMASTAIPPGCCVLPAEPKSFAQVSDGPASTPPVPPLELVAPEALGVPAPVPPASCVPLLAVLPPAPPVPAGFPVKSNPPKMLVHAESPTAPPATTSPHVPL